MANKDTKGRNLKPRESQMADGRYRYRYVDKQGKHCVIYSWKLVPNDKIPKGKKDDISLREKVRLLERDLEENIDTTSAKMTTNELIQIYLSTKTRLANKTKENYKHMWNKNIKDSIIGNMKICDVKKSDILKLYAYLYNEKGFAVSTLQLYQNLLYPTFQLAVDDSLIRLNPCKNCMKEYVRGSLSTTKEALSREEQQALIDYIKNNKAYIMHYPIILFMLGTGCRIGEALGITWRDINTKEKIVKIDHQVIYDLKDGKNRFYATLPKTKKSRVIPIQDSLLKILQEHKQKTYFLSAGSGFEVDGYNHFVFVNSKGNLPTPGSIDRTLRTIRDNYNKLEMERASYDSRKALLLPNISAHILRHTYCTRMAENGIDIKVLQELMGHANIGVTMQVYNHVNSERVQKEMERIQDVLEA